MTTSAASCAPFTKTTAFSINLNVCGMGQTGKTGSVAGEPSKDAFSLMRLWAMCPSGMQSKGDWAPRPGWDALCVALLIQEGRSEQKR